jgi:hypothetical protein
MTQTGTVRRIRHIIAAQCVGDMLYMVLTSYWETDAPGAVGQVVRIPKRRGGGAVSDLNTDNQLRNMWASPQGSLWVGSSDGNMWTTANVPWPDSAPGVDQDQSQALRPWRFTRLPDMRGLGYKPIMTAVWGTADADVHVGTFEGGMYHWDGRAWAQIYPDVTSSINHIHGTARDDVYAVGENGVVLHYDGRAWRELPYPGDGGDTDGLTGVRALSRDEAFICGRSGRILHGSRHGLEVLGEFQAAFYGVAHFQNRIFLSAGDAGVWELKGNRTEVVKDNFGTVGVFECDDALYFVEPIQASPRVIEYRPSVVEGPWAGRAF